MFCYASFAFLFLFLFHIIKICYLKLSVFEFAGRALVMCKRILFVFLWLRCFVCLYDHFKLQNIHSLDLISYMVCILYG